MLVKVNYMLISNGKFRYIEIRDYNNVRSISVLKNVVTIDTRLNFIKLKRDQIVELKIYE